MKLTKREHACQTIEESGAVLVIDPGNFTAPVENLTGVVAIVITHEHADHWTAEQLGLIRASSPGARILGPAGVVAAAINYPVETVKSGDAVEVGPFRLSFHGGSHEVIHRSIPVIDNLGVMVNNRLYYGGDSYSKPGVPVEVLAVPVGAGWLKIGDVMDYVAAIAPRQSYPVHEATLSAVGRELSYGRIADATARAGGTFVPLEPGATLDLV